MMPPRDGGRQRGGTKRISAEFVMRLWLSLLALWLAFAGNAFAEKRIALVIGENQYSNLPADQQLHNAVNDARAMKVALEALHFDVDLEENLGRDALIDKLSDFGARLDRDDIAFFFYAGHGVSFDGANYLLPSDIHQPQSTGRDEQDRVVDHSIAETRVLERIRKSGVKLAVVVLDACRDNPLKDAADRSIGDTRGLSRAPSVRGVLEIYSAGPGQTALDGDDKDANSIFTKVFAERLRTPGLGLRDLAYKTQAEVYQIAAARGHDQFPVVASQIISDDDIYLAGRPTGTAADSAAAAQQSAFNSAVAADTPAALQAFVDAYPSGPLADILRQRLTRLAALTPAPIVTPKPPAPCGGILALASLASRGVGVLSRDEICALKHGDVFKECAECPAMVVIPEGSFTMGAPASESVSGPYDHNEWPQHVVKFAKAFAVGEFDVTRDEFAAFERETGHDAGSKCFSWNEDDSKLEQTAGRSWRDPGFPQTGSHPVACVSWNDAAAYVEWLAKKTEQPYRLPSESEWEYAARGQTAPGAYPRYFFGDSESDFCRYGNGADQTAKKKVPVASRWTVAPCDDGFAYTSPVGSFKPNAFGLYDMLGNVGQWVEDCYRDNYNGALDDGSVITTKNCSQGVTRGGSWIIVPRILRVAVRDQFGRSDRSFGVGFRVARTLPP